MKKREVIKQKNKLKQVRNLKYLKFAKYACLFLIVMFLIYVGAMSASMNISFEELMSKNAVVIVGFMICTANLYVWYILKHFLIKSFLNVIYFLTDIENYEHIESIRINLIVLSIAQVFLLNYISAGLMILSLVKYFQWNQFSFKKSLKEIKKEGQLSVLIISLIVMSLFVALVFGIFFSVK
ncbi:hypothetical protein [Anaerorhabdus sp.]|uniref:hypothetical protein n=1 Tax=Anaerorhabdus sp. TaxID=1872524 RepID=UPI002FC5C7AE